MVKDSIRDEGFEYIGSQEDRGPSSHGKTSSTGNPDPSFLRSLSILALRRLLALGMEKVGIVIGDGGNECGGVNADCRLSPSVLSSDMSLRSDTDTESVGLVDRVRFDGIGVRSGRVMVLYPGREDAFHVLNGQQEELRTSSSSELHEEVDVEETESMEVLG